jgi:RNA polymerase sigma factor (sigma-70 family)
VYLRRMLINAQLSWRRKRSSAEAPAVLSEPVDSTDIGSESAERDAVWRLIVRLPPKQRATIVLRYYEDLDDVAIAEILGCSPVTVRTHAMRALAALRLSPHLSMEGLR